MTKDKLIAWLEKEISDINDTFPKCIAYKIALAALKADKMGLVMCENRDEDYSWEYTPVENELDIILGELE